MRKNRKLSFEELVRENKLEILKNEEELDKIERKIEERQLKRLNNSKNVNGLPVYIFFCL